MELKCVQNQNGAWEKFGSNRTFMELKYGKLPLTNNRRSMF